MRAAAPHQPSFVSHPLALLAACLMAGILAAGFVAMPLGGCLAAGVICSAGAVWFLSRRRLTGATLAAACAFFCAGAALESFEKGAGANSVRRLFDAGALTSGDPAEAAGVLKRAPEPAPDGFYLTLSVEKLRVGDTERSASGVLWLFAPARDRSVRDEYEALGLRYGARVRVMSALNRADDYRNPGVSSYTEYLERRGYDASGVIKSPLLIERLDDERVFLPLALLYEWRRGLMAEVDRAFSAETAGVLKASLLGNRYYLSHGAAERFRDGGTFHVLVISGLHISFVGGLVLLLARRATKSRAWQFSVSAVTVWAYAFAVGAESSVVRAALMFTMVALAPVLHRRAASLNALGGAALVLLVWRPGDLFDPSFQLTFLSVLAIISTLR